MKSDKPLWVQHMEGTVTRPGSDYWKTTGSTLPLRYTGGKPGYDNFSLPRAKDTGSGKTATGKGTHSDTASLLSRSSRASAKSERKAAKRLGLILLLLVLALLLAAGLGVLVYYLLLSDAPDTWRQRTLADASVRILNETYSPTMSNNTSPAFRRIAEPFCEEMDGYFLDTEYEKRYNGCRVVELRDVGANPDCSCFAGGAGSVEVIYELAFLGKLGDTLSDRIPAIIEDRSTKKQRDDSVHVLIKNFLVDIRVHWKQPYNAIMAGVTVPVYNLTYSNSLAYHNSTAYQAHAVPFCADIDEFLQSSWMSSRYLSCEVTNFGNNPTSVSVDLKFRGEDIRDIQTGLIYVIMTSAPNVTVGYQTLKMIGNLLVVPYNIDLSLEGIQLVTTTTTTPTTTTTTTTPPTTWPGDGVYVRKTLRVLNLTYTDPLNDPTSPDFSDLSGPFCDDLGRLYGLSPYGGRYHSCRVYTFKDRPTSVVFTVLFRGKEWRGMDNSVVRVIRTLAPRVDVKGKEAYRVGSLLVLLGEGDQTLGPTTLPSLFSTVTPTASVIIIHDGVRLDTYLKLYNLTYTDDLGDPSTLTFKRHASLFCDDLRRFYSLSEFSSRYDDCDVTAISPSTMLYFNLVFRGSDFRGLQDSVNTVIRRHARVVQIGRKLYYRVGDLLVLPNDIYVTLVPTNITMATSSVQWAMTSSFEMTSSLVESSSVYDGPLATVPLTYRLHRFTQTPSLSDPGSDLFRSYQAALCRELTRVYSRTPVLESLYFNCEINGFSTDPSSITFSVVFKTRDSPTLREVTKRSLESQLPRYNVTGARNTLYEVMPAGGMLFLLRNMTLPPEVKTVTVVPPAQTVTHVVKPSLTSSYMTIAPGHMTIQMTYFLYDFLYSPSLAFPTSGDFRNIQAKLCETLRMIYRRTAVLGHVFESCAVNEFGSNPDSITFHVDFTSQYPDALRQVAIDTLHKSEPHVILSDFELLPVSDLFFILKNYDVVSTSYIMPSTSSIHYSTPEMMTSSAEYTTTPISPTLVPSVHVYSLFNLTFTPDLFDPTSDLYIYYQTRFCEELERLYSVSYISSAYRHCVINNITNVDLTDPTNNTVAFTLYFDTPVFPQLQGDIIYVIENQSPRRNISGYTVTRIGDLDLILGRFNAVLVNPFDNSTYIWVPSSTYFDIRQSTISVTLTSSHIVTSSIPPTTTQDPRENYVLSLFDYGLVNFRYYPELAYPESDLYKMYQRRFCEDIEKFYRHSVLAAAYRDCRITEFSPDSQNVSFRFWFETPLFPQLQSYVLNILESQAPKLNISTDTVLDVGDLYLRYKNFTNKVVTPDPRVTTIVWVHPSTTAVKVEPSSTSEITMSSIPTTTPPPPDWIKAVFNYGLLNFDFYPELKNPDSMLYQIYQRKFCEDIANFYRNSYLAAAFRECQIRSFSPDGRDITFDFAFDTPMFPQLQSYILEILESGPRLNVSGTTVLDVGDLYLILRNHSYILITPDPDVTTLSWVPPSTTALPSSTVTPTPSSTIQEISSTTPLPDNWLKAVFKYGLLNFDYYPELKDPNSMLFKIYRRKFCYDMESFYRTSYLAAAFRDCVIRSFSPDSKIEFDIQFETPVFPNLQSYILSVFESQAPRLNMSGHNVLDVGDLYLIWGNYSYVIVTPDPEISTITWVPPSSFVPTSTIQPEPTSTIVMTSSVVPTTPAPRDWVVAMFNYSMFDFTWMPELADRTSVLYKLYENKFCNDIERFYRPTYLNRAFRDCEITSFGKDSETIEFRVSFDTPVFPSLQGDILYFLEEAAPRFNISTYTVMDVGDIYLIWKNFSYAIITPEPIITTIMWTPSSSITPTSTTQVTPPSITPTTPTTTTEDPSLNWLHARFDFRLLDFSYLPDLADPNSQLYQIYERKFCDDMRRFYDQSYLSMVYRGCKIREFHPDGRIRYHLALETPVFPNLMSDIIATLYKGAPKMDIRQHEVLDVGGLLLVWSNYTLQIVPPQPYSTTLFWTPPSSTPPVTTTTIETSFSSVEMTSSIYTTPEPPEYVLAIFRFGLLDFPYHPDLANKDSMLFKLVQKKFCDDIRKLYQRTYLSVVFRECHISEFGTDPDTFKFYIAFETPVFNRLQGDILNVLETEAPRLNMYGYTVLDIGELFLMWANFSYILVDEGMKSTIQWSHTVTPTSTYTTQSTITTTTMPTTTEATYQLKLSFEVLNLTMSETLRNVNSAEFKLREQLFCNDISQLLLNHPFKFPDYKSCRFDQFTSDPLRINYSLVFIGQQPEEMSERVVGILIEGAPRENYLDLIGLRVGNMLIAIDNFTVHIHNYSTLPPLFTTPPVSYDALLYNITFKMFPGNYSTAMEDTSSSYYRQITKRFCSEIRQYFGNSYVRDRYYSCKVDGITGGRNPTLNANVIVSGTYDFGAPLIYDVINSSASVFNFGGRRWLRIGDFLLYADSPGESILIQWGYISTTPAPTTPLPSTFTILDLRANILNMTYNPAFALTSSAAFRSYAIPFCQFLGKKFTERNRFPDYFGCRVVSISNNPFSVRFSLRFRGMQEEFLQALVPDIIIEWTRTPEADRLIVGPLTLDERSIRVKQRYISDGNIVTRGPLRTTPSVFIPTTPAPPTTTAGSNPCPPGAFNTIEPHRSQCNKFYLCNGGVAMEMTCAPGQILDAVYRMCILKPPGHVCQL